MAPTDDDASRDHPPAADPFRWLKTPEWDRSPHAEFRREVEALAREVMQGREGPGGDAAGSTPLGDDSSATLDDDSSATLDVTGGTPFRVFQLARALTAALDRGGEGGGPMSVAEDLVLLEVARRPATTARRLQRRLHIPRSTASSLIARLVDRGLLRRRPAPYDRRVRLLAPTDAGRRAARATADRWERVDAGLLRGALSAGQRDALRRLARLAHRGLS